MGIRDYRDLEVWQRAMELQDAAYDVARRLPIEERHNLASQIRRASVSVPANIAEGHSRPDRADYRRFVGIARASARELESHLECVITARYRTRADLKKALSLADRVSRMLERLHEALE